MYKLDHMRRKLKALVGKRELFSAKIGRLGKQESFGWYPDKELVKLKEIRDAQGNDVGDLWSYVTQTFANAQAEPGDRIEFRATVKRYQRPCEPIDDCNTDYRFSHPVNIRKLEQGQAENYAPATQSHDKE